MKVLMTADTVGGVWTYAVELIRASPSIQFVLATMGRLPSSAQRAELAPLANATLEASSWKLEWMDDPWSDVDAAGTWLLELAARHKPDLVHLNGYAHAALPFGRPKLVVAHSCVASWWRAVKGTPAPAEWNRYRTEVERGLRAADLIVAPTAAMLGTLDRNYRFDTPSEVIYNAAEARAFAQGAKEQFVFAAGRLWDEAKNLSALAAAAPAIRWPVRIAGDGGTSTENITHLGWLDRDAMRATLAAASLYVFPAVYEPFGLSILEAALSGCALILGDTLSLRELWDGAAEFVDPHDPAAIAAATNALIEDNSRRTALAVAARDRAAMFTPERMAAHYLAIWQRLLDNRRDRREPHPADSRRTSETSAVSGRSQESSEART
jgi:glycosyltransferase involved in cell wall biosynthesis